jgi:hypothetical protein
MTFRGFLFCLLVILNPLSIRAPYYFNVLYTDCSLTDPTKITANFLPLFESAPSHAILTHNIL